MTSRFSMTAVRSLKSIYLTLFRVFLPKFMIIGCEEVYPFYYCFMFYTYYVRVLYIYKSNYSGKPTLYYNATEFETDFYVIKL